MASENVYLKGLKVLVVTWNVNAKVETESKIMDLFKPMDLDQSDEDVPEVIVVCFQEVVELSASNVVIGQSQEKVDQWETVVSSALPGYEKIASNSMVGLWIGIYAIHELRVFITEIQVGSFARGIGGVLGNKGAVLIRFQLFDSSVCFINSHFAAHRENVLKRNEDFHAILMHNTFPDYLRTKASSVINNTLHTAMGAELEQRMKEFKKRRGMQTDTGNMIGNGTEPNNKSSMKDSVLTEDRSVDRYLSPDDHDIIIWAGDLNYRIIPGIDTSQVYQIIREGKALLLAPYDQLNQERESGNVFQGFHEGLLTFEPTYKYIPGTDFFDDRKDKKLRCPSWCDRILWRIGRGLGAELIADFEAADEDLEDEQRDRRREAINLRHMTFSKGNFDSRCDEVVELMKYQRCPNIISDHKPVRALLNIKVKSVDWSSHEKNLIERYNKMCAKSPFSSKYGNHSTGVSGLLPFEILNRKSIHFQAVLPDMRVVVCKLCNNIPTHSIQFEICASTLPRWLNIMPMQGSIPALGSLTLTLVVNTEQATLCYAENTDRSSRYSKKELPLLGPYLSTENYYRKGSKMEVCHILVITAQAHECVVAQVSAEEQPPSVYVSDLLIPVVCSLDNPNDFDEV